MPSAKDTRWRWDSGRVSRHVATAPIGGAVPAGGADWGATRR